MLTRRKIFIFTALAAIAARLPTALAFGASPFRAFHKVPGLDMETLLRFGEWGNPALNYTLFVPHRFLVFTIWKLNGQNHLPEAIIAIQCLLGVAGALMVADLALRLSGRRPVALGAGVLAGCCPLFILYEFTVLQESVQTFFILFAFWLTVRCARRGFAGFRSVAAGAALGLAAVGRPTAILFSPLLAAWATRRLFRKTPQTAKRRSVALWGGLLGLWLLAGGFNGTFSSGSNFNPFFNVIPYTLAFNAPPAPAETKTAEKKAAPAPPGMIVKFFRLGIKMTARLPRLFSSEEIPENLNYYFLRKRLPLPGSIFGPALIIPAAAAGILWLLLTGRGFRREGLVLLPIASMMLFLCVRDPIGRYRLLLLPELILAAALPFESFFRRNRKPALLLLLLLAGCFLIEAFLTPPPRERPADYTAWGLAQRARAGRTTFRALDSFRAAWEQSGFTDESAAVNCILGSIENGKARFALQTATEGLQRGQVNPSLLHYYRALILMPNARAAESELLQVKPERIAPLAFRYWFLRAEARRFQNDFATAEKFYARALAQKGGGRVRHAAEQRLRQMRRMPKNVLPYNR